MKRFINKTQRVRRDKLNVNQKCTKFKVSFSILQTAVIECVNEWTCNCRHGKGEATTGEIPLLTRLSQQ